MHSFITTAICVVLVSLVTHDLHTISVHAILPPQPPARGRPAQQLPLIFNAAAEDQSPLSSWAISDEKARITITPQGQELRHPDRAHIASICPECILPRLVRYDYHKVVRISRPPHLPGTSLSVRQRRAALDELLRETLGLDIWSSTPDHVDVRVSPEQFVKLQDALELEYQHQKEVEGGGKPRRISMRIVNENLQLGIDQETERLERSLFREKQSGLALRNPTSWFSEYHRYDAIVQWFHDLAQQYPELIQVIPSIGKTYEKRDILAVKISSSSGAVGSKPQFWFHGGDHAREWIAGATVQYLVHHFLSKYGVDEEVTQMLDRAEFIIVPIMNVDGYEFTWTNSRLWRKNRRPIKKDFFGSVGVDLNRNWPEHWNEGGSSSQPYSETYHGPSPGSEPEVQALRNFFLLQNHTRLIGAIDFHSYSQLILRPYGWTTRPAPDEKLARKAADTMRDLIYGVHQKKYVSEREIDLYKASGTASDWFYGKEVNEFLGGHKRLYAYTIELRPSADDGGWGGEGFILPPEQIVPTGELL
ncbi:hypothetical protein HK102_000323 [Quaeritorhiza haematococci]|nr:hypothetical protein HK102_000323 [Quaeritorhiza haematococci]